MSVGPPDPIIADRIWAESQSGGFDGSAADVLLAGGVNASSAAAGAGRATSEFATELVGAVDGVNSFLRVAADALGTTEPGLRLLVSLFLGYPVALLHRHLVSSQRPWVQNAFFAICGVLVAVFNYGWSAGHCLLCILVQYATLRACGSHWASPAFSMVFQMSYLLFGYWYTSMGDDYDISWTLPHCVLTLRLIGVAFDHFDGHKSPDELTRDQKLTALRRCPTPLELMGHALFPASFMVGPQFPMQRYKFLIRGDLKRVKDKAGRALTPPVALALARLGLGLVYMGLYVFGSPYFPVSYGVSEDLLGRPLWQRLFFVAVWAKVNVMKYLGCWLITEGACILSGLSFNGFDSNGAARWDGCRNIHVYLYETATEYQHMIMCFNTNTNAWVANYVYKRLKHLNKKHVSHMAAMAFLAVWHGLHFGYYVTFFNEYVIISRERDFYQMLDKSPVWARFHSRHPWVRPLLLPLKVAWLWCGLSYAVVPFLLFSNGHWWTLYCSLYFHIHVVFLAYPLLKPALRTWLQVPDHPQSPLQQSEWESKKAAAVQQAATGLGHDEKGCVEDDCGTATRAGGMVKRKND